MICCQNCKCVAERGSSLRVTASQLNIEKLTQHPHGEGQQKPVEHHSPTSRLRLLRVIPFLLGRWGSSSPCETFCWACLERLSLQLKLRAFSVAAGFHLCLISGWMMLCLTPGPVLLVPVGPGCSPSSPNLGHKPFASETEPTKNQSSFPNFNPTLQFFHFWRVYVFTF